MSEPVCLEPTLGPPATSCRHQLPAPAAWASYQCLQWYQAGGHGHTVLNSSLRQCPGGKVTGSNGEGGTHAPQAPVWPCTLNSPQSLQRAVGLGCPEGEGLGPVSALRLTQQAQAEGPCDPPGDPRGVCTVGAVRSPNNCPLLRGRCRSAAGGICLQAHGLGRTSALHWPPSALGTRVGARGARWAAGAPRPGSSHHLLASFTNFSIWVVTTHPYNTRRRGLILGAAHTHLCPEWSARSWRPRWLLLL